MRCLKGEFRTFDPASVRVLCVDGGKEPLATFGDRLSDKATTELQRLGVELRMGARVVGVDALGVDVRRRRRRNVSHRRLHRDLWAAGVQASPLAGELAKASGAPVDRAGRIEVLPDLTLPGHPEVFAVGDMAALDDLPGVAEVAMQGGLHAANTISRRLNGKESVPFKYRDLGQRRHHRPVPGHRQRRQAALQRVRRLAHLVLRPPCIPDGLRQPPHHDAPLAPVDDRPWPVRA